MAALLQVPLSLLHELAYQEHNGAGAIPAQRKSDKKHDQVALAHWNLQT
jgi:hypothetical protein